MTHRGGTPTAAHLREFHSGEGPAVAVAEQEPSVDPFSFTGDKSQIQAARNQETPTLDKVKSDAWWERFKIDPYKPEREWIQRGLDRFAPRQKDVINRIPGGVAAALLASSRIPQALETASVVATPVEAEIQAIRRKTEPWMKERAERLANNFGLNPLKKQVAEEPNLLMRLLGRSGLGELQAQESFGHVADPIQLYHAKRGHTYEGRWYPGKNVGKPMPKGDPSANKFIQAAQVVHQLAADEREERTFAQILGGIGGLENIIPIGGIAKVSTRIANAGARTTAQGLANVARQETMDQISSQARMQFPYTGGPFQQESQFWRPLLDTEPVIDPLSTAIPMPGRVPPPEKPPMLALPAPAVSPPVKPVSPSGISHMRQIQDILKNKPFTWTFPPSAFSEEALQANPAQRKILQAARLEASIQREKMRNLQNLVTNDFTTTVRSPVEPKFPTGVPQSVKRVVVVDRDNPWGAYKEVQGRQAYNELMALESAERHILDASATKEQIYRARQDLIRAGEIQLSPEEIDPILGQRYRNRMLTGQAGDEGTLLGRTEGRDRGSRVTHLRGGSPLRAGTGGLLDEPTSLEPLMPIGIPADAPIPPIQKTLPPPSERVIRPAGIADRGERVRTPHDRSEFTKRFPIEADSPEKAANLRRIQYRVVLDPTVKEAERLSPPGIPPKMGNTTPPTVSDSTKYTEFLAAHPDSADRIKRLAIKEITEAIKSPDVPTNTLDVVASKYYARALANIICK
jgi:hypothetical protein